MALMYTKGRMQPSGGATSSSGFGSVSPSRLEAPIWPKEFQNDSQKGLSSFREPPKACAAFLMGYGDLDTMEGFPGAPAASRGFPGGGHSKWSFERCPSLLPGHLERDRGLRGRSCAGLPPSASNMPNGSAASFKGACSAWDSQTAGQGQYRMMSPSMAKSQSAGHLLSQSGSPTRSYSGLQGVIGTTWDNASVTAGDRYRGSDGRFLGL